MSRDRFLETVLVVLILILSAYLRLTNVVDNPGWYSDEGTLIEIADNLQHGEIKYLAINRSILIAGRLPIFPFLLAGLFKIYGSGMQTLRIFTGCLGILSVGLLYIVVRGTQTKNSATLAILSAAMLAIYPSAILYNRIGFSYNLLTPLVLITFWGMWRYLTDGRLSWLFLSALAVGIGCVSDLMMFTLIPVVLLAVSTRSWRDLLWSLVIMGLPFAIYMLSMLLVDAEAFLFDLQFTLSRLGGLPLIAQYPATLRKYYDLLHKNTWFVAALIGLFMLASFRLRCLSLSMLLIPILLLGRTLFIGSDIGLYYLSPFFPFIALGFSAFILKAIPFVLDFSNKCSNHLFEKWNLNPKNQKNKWIQHRIQVLGSSLALFTIVLSPLLISLYSTIGELKYGYQTPIDPVLVNPRDARQAANFVNRQIDANQSVLASPAIAWLIEGNVADFQMAVATQGKTTKHFPTNIPTERFDFDPVFTKAKLVILDPIWRNWAAVNMPEVAAMMSEIETWKLVFQVGEIKVFENDIY